MSSQTNQVVTWAEKNQYLVDKGINETCWNVLCNTLYPSSKPESVILAWDYCQSRELDIMMKPIHLVPMSVKNPQTGTKEWRDIPMPGVGLYRIQASRSGDYAGADEPEFGPVIEAKFKDTYKGEITVKYPEWCKYTVYKLMGDRIVSFSAKEYWLENYATSGKDGCPNAMWQKRVYGQLGKCTEAQALRKAWPEIGQEPTAEEMEGKEYFVGNEKDITPTIAKPDEDQKLHKIFERGIKAIENGDQNADQIMAFIKDKKLVLPSEKEAILRNIKVAS